MRNGKDRNIGFFNNLMYALDVIDEPAGCWPFPNSEHKLIVLRFDLILKSYHISVVMRATFCETLI